MAAGDVFIPAKLKKAQADQVSAAPIDFDSDTLMMMLVRAGSGIPDTSKTGVLFVADVTAGNAEVSGGTYARQTVAGKTVAFDASSSVVEFSHSAVTFAQDAASGPTDARYAIGFKDVGGADSSRVVYAVIDLGGTVSLRAGDLVLTPPAAGLINW